MTVSSDVVLILPPQWSPLQPYLSLPALTAYLRTHGVSASQHDLSIEFYDTLLSREQLLPMCRKLVEVYERLKEKPELSADEQLYFYSIFLVRAAFDEVLDQIDDTKEFFRSERFFVLDDLRVRSSILNVALNIVNIFSGACLGLGDLEFPVDVSSLGAIDRYLARTDDAFLTRFFRRQVEELFSQRSCAVAGISVNNPSQIVPALIMAQWIKAHHPEIHLTLGGNLLTRWSDNLRSHPEFFRIYADSVVLYEGERPLLALVEAVKRGGSLDDVPNLMYLSDVEDAVTCTRLAPPEDVNALPTPDFDGLPLSRYLSPYAILPVLTSRGCYWGRCTFCDHSFIYRGGFRQRRADLVVQDLQTLSDKYGTRHFSFADEGTAPAACRRISQEILRRGLDVSLMTQIRMEVSFTPETARLMARAGMRMVFIGLESACPRILRQIDKGIDIGQGPAILQGFRDAGIMVHLFVLFGFPGETDEDARETFRFVLDNRDSVFSAGASVLGVGKYSPIGLHSDRYRLELVPLTGEKALAYIYDFDYTSGQSEQSVAKLRDDFMCMVRTELRFGAIWGYMFREQFFLYALRYPEQELYEVAERHLAFQDDLYEPTTNGPVPSTARPALKLGVYLAKLPFDVDEIQRGLARGGPAPVRPETCFVLCNILTQQHLRVSEDGFTMLTLCDGERSISDIVEELASLFPTDPASLQDGARSFLEHPSVRTYLAFLRTAAPVSVPQ